MKPVCLLLSAMFLAGFAFGQSPYASLQIPKVISYQGRVTQNGAAWNPVTGEGYFVFALVQSGSVLWNNYDGSSSPTDPASTSLGVDQMLSLPVSGGQFSVRLGATGTSGKNREIPATVFFDTSNNSVRGQVKLAVWFSADANTFTRLSPDVDLASVPYALVAGIAETVQDRAIGTAKIADGAVNQINMAVNSVQTAQLQDAAITTDKMADASVLGSKLADTTITSDKLVADVAQALVPAGSVMPFAGTVAPAGWVFCDGSSQLRTDPAYTRLFGVIGTAHGSADGTHFNLPDYRGRFLRGVDGTAGNDPDKTARTAMATGGVTGNNVGSTQADELRSHNHVLPLRVIGGTAYNVGGGNASDTGNPKNVTNATGGSETRPVNAYVHFIIKL